MSEKQTEEQPTIYKFLDINNISLLSGKHKPVNQRARILSYKSQIDQEVDKMENQFTQDQIAVLLKGGQYKNEDLPGLKDSGTISDDTFKALYTEKSDGLVAKLEGVLSRFSARHPEKAAEVAEPVKAFDDTKLTEAIKGLTEDTAKSFGALSDAVTTVAETVKGNSDRIQKLASKSAPEDIRVNVGHHNIFEDTSRVNPLHKSIVKSICSENGIQPDQPIGNMPKEVLKAITSGTFTQGITHQEATSFLRAVDDTSVLLQRIGDAKGNPARWEEMTKPTLDIDKTNISAAVLRTKAQGVDGETLADTVTPTFTNRMPTASNLIYAKVTLDDAVKGFQIEGAAYFNNLMQDISYKASGELDNLLLNGDTGGATTTITHLFDGIITLNEAGTGQNYDVDVLDAAWTDKTFPGWDTGENYRASRAFRMTKNTDNSIAWLRSHRKDYVWCVSPDVKSDMMQWVGTYGNDAEKSALANPNHPVFKGREILEIDSIVADGGNNEWVGLLLPQNHVKGMFMSQEWGIETERRAPDATVFYLKMRLAFNYIYAEGFNGTSNIES